DYFRHNGGGEMLVFSAADFEDFRQPRPDMPASMESELEGVVRILAENRWPWRLHATYEETIARALDVFERVHRDAPIDRLHWFIDHAETISARSIDRIAALGGGIAIQHRMAYQGEYFVERYGARAAETTPPIADMLARGVRTSAGTDATRVASYNPWVSLAWLVTGKTVGGLSLYPSRNRFDRETALRMWTENVAWFSNEEGNKGRIEVGQLADVIVPDRDYFHCAEHEIADATSDLTIVGGRIVYAANAFRSLDDGGPPAAVPDWSPVRTFGGYGAWARTRAAVARSSVPVAPVHHHAGHCAGHALWGAAGCSCWAF
ncbi:MAG TPA: amidohydrolase family protein, partial [Pseudomonadales bacterium]|nr:amidohydrolase family protein [Pseudomonadales bacterium]